MKSADGVPIVFDVRGRGSGRSGAAAAVFVHGWAGRREHWDEQFEAFAHDRLVVRLDLAGHGASGQARDRWSVGAFAGDVEAVIDALGVDRVVLIGHSLGGSVIVEAARRLAGRVVRLVGVDTWSAIGVRKSVEELEASVLLPQMRENFDAGLWWQVLADLNIDLAWYAQRYRPVEELLPWDHINVKKGREYLEKEQTRSLLQLEVMADAK